MKGLKELDPDEQDVEDNHLSSSSKYGGEITVTDEFDTEFTGTVTRGSTQRGSKVFDGSKKKVGKYGCTTYTATGTYDELENVPEGNRFHDEVPLKDESGSDSGKPSKKGD